MSGPAMPNNKSPVRYKFEELNEVPHGSFRDNQKLSELVRRLVGGTAH